MKKIADFSIKYYQYLNQEGNVVNPLPEFAKDKTLLQAFYRSMILTRVFDAKAVALQRTGNLGTFPASLGQEAVFAAIGMAMKDNDVYAPYYRDQGTFFQRKIRPRDVFTYWGGDERGSSYPQDSQDFPVCIPIASQCLHGAGAAYAIKLRKEQRAVVTLVGEGGTSEGDFYEAMNFAGTHQLPIVFVINNNQWAISVPHHLQSHSSTFAQKAIAADIAGEQVDGNDVFAIYDRLNQAVHNARQGNGPSVIEAKTYRLCDHTTADDAKRYVPKTELEQAWQCEPIKRFQAYLLQQGILTEKDIEDIDQETRHYVEEEVKAYLAIEKAQPTAMFDHLYAELPQAFYDQYEELKKGSS